MHHLTFKKAPPSQTLLYSYYTITHAKNLYLSRLLAFLCLNPSEILVPSVAPATTTAPSETVLLTQPEVIG